MAIKKNWVMMGVTTILLPLGKWVLEKMINRLTQVSEQAAIAEKGGGQPFAGVKRVSEKGC